MILEFWRDRFSRCKLNHFVFRFERYGGNGKDEVFGFSGSVAYDTDPTKPIGDWKEAWEAAKKRAGVSCRFHDLRHTGCTRMLEAGVPFSVVAEIMGWSASTSIRMAKRYGHIGQTARHDAIKKLSLSASTFDLEGAQECTIRKTNRFNKPMMSGPETWVTSLTKSALSTFLGKGFAFVGVHISRGAVCTCPLVIHLSLLSTPSCGSAHIPFHLSVLPTRHLFDQ